MGIQNVTKMLNAHSLLCGSCFSYIMKAGATLKHRNWFSNYNWTVQKAALPACSMQMEFPPHFEHE
jgi:hypothetical protein